jgi:hypothetical protein
MEDVSAASERRFDSRLRYPNRPPTASPYRQNVRKAGWQRVKQTSTKQTVRGGMTKEAWISKALRRRECGELQATRAWFALARTLCELGDCAAG